MIIKLSFPIDSNETIIKIKSFSEGFDCLNSSYQFQSLLRNILNISNYLNSNSRYGNLIGFNLSYLNNLDLSKSFINKNYKMHSPGVEPGSSRWQRPILPLNHECLLLCIKFLYLYW